MQAPKGHIGLPVAGCGQPHFAEPRAAAMGAPPCRVALAVLAVLALAIGPARAATGCELCVAAVDQLQGGQVSSCGTPATNADYSLVRRAPHPTLPAPIGALITRGPARRAGWGRPVLADGPSASGQHSARHQPALGGLHGHGRRKYAQAGCSVPKPRHLRRRVSRESRPGAATPFRRGHRPHLAVAAPPPTATGIVYVSPPRTRRAHPDAGTRILGGGRAPHLPPRAHRAGLVAGPGTPYGDAD